MKHEYEKYKLGISKMIKKMHVEKKKWINEVQSTLDITEQKLVCYNTELN